MSNLTVPDRHDEPIEGNTIEIECLDCDEGVVECPKCEGKKIIESIKLVGTPIVVYDCPECEGTGKIPCETCNGTGFIEVDKNEHEENLEMEEADRQEEDRKLNNKEG